MSWMKRAPGGPPPPAEQQFAAPQQYGNQQNAYPNYQSGVSGSNPPQQYWQAPPQPQPTYNQQYGQVYQQPADYGGNANQFYQQPQQQQQYSQNFPNQTYSNPQQGYQQNYYQNQGVPQQQQNYVPNKNNDGWEDNWNWGWEDQSKAQKGSGASQSAQQAPPPVYNNANVIEESFTSTDSWNWAMEEKKEVKDHHPAGGQGALPPQTGQSIAPAPDHNTRQESSQHEPPPPSVTEEVRTLNDTEVVKEQLPNLALGKRFHIDNLTPQWSIESQMSQDSSDGPQTQSEGTFRSEMQSRNSDKSNCSHHSLDEPYSQNADWSQQSLDEPTLADNVPKTNQTESHNELTNSFQDMSITNSQNPAPDSSVAKEPLPVSCQENLMPLLPPPPSLTPNFSMPHPNNQPLHPPPTSSQSSSSLPPPISGSLPPPASFPPPLQSSNPFKHAGPFSHKSNAAKVPSGTNLTPSQPFPPPTSSSTLTSPAAVNKASHQSRGPVGYGANLETTPDNSERPDHPQVMPFKPMQVAQPVPENLEVAPRSDRNEYLQTAHLSSGDYGENTDFSRNPPPGLRRMVVGQQESEYNQTLNLSGDEPPPGLARMVPGQQNEAENSYNQASDNYLDRHIDGQPTESGARPYRQADGQQTPDNYTQPSRAAERRPVGLARMVPGEPSNDEYSQYQAPSYASNEQRVVTGVDRDYPVQADAGPSDVREQNVDGSDYTVQTTRNNDLTPDFTGAPEEQQREVTMEGENLQDLSIVSSTEVSFSREHTLDGADVTATDLATDRKTDASDSLDHPATSSRRQSLNHVNTSGDDSERDRLFKNSPRRDKHRSARDRDREKEGRYSRGDRKAERGERWERDESPGARRQRRGARPRRYDTEDTDYYSDRERERRRYREGSYASKPPRPEDKDRRYEDRDRSRRYNTIERDRHHVDERDGTSRRRERERDRHSERRYRDIDPARKYGNLRRERDEEERRRELGSPSRAESREPRADEERRYRERDRRSRHARPYYDDVYGAGYSDPYQLQRAQYEYYEHLRHTDPAAYMQVYKQILAGHPPPPDRAARGFVSLRDFQPEERGSVHSGRSSANDLKGNDTLYGYRAAGGAGSLRGAGNVSLRTDLSDRDLNTDASLNLQLEESTVRSERMTPFKYSTAHIKGSVSSRDVVVVRPSYPVDGAPATVHVLALGAALRAARDPHQEQLAAYPGPLVKGVTHKKSVIEYCTARARSAHKDGRRDPVGYALVWELLALLLTQNGVVEGADIAELLMKNKKEYEYQPVRNSDTHHGSRRESSLSGSAREDERAEPERADATLDVSPELTPLDQGSQPPVEQAEALDRLRELLIYGNRQEAIEWAMQCGLWGHALQLAAHGPRRARELVLARFLHAQPRADPLHTLYAAQQAAPAASCVAGDWRPHAAIVLANAASCGGGARALAALGAALAARGRPYSAQFCRVAAGAQPQPHPLQPLQAAPVTSIPQLSLLLADHNAPTLSQFATNEAIFATEIYEYALSLHQDFVIESMHTYKLVLASRLCDVGDYERALGYVEAARGAAEPAVRRALAALADRLQPAAAPPAAPPAPAQPPWLLDVCRLADQQPSAAPSPQSTPQHQLYENQQYNSNWGEQNQYPAQTAPPYEPAAAPPEEPPEYAQFYYQQQPPPPPELDSSPAAAAPAHEAQPAPPADPAPPQYWQPEPHYHYTDNMSSTNGAADAPRPMITMPGGHGPSFNSLDDDRPPSADQSERETDTPKPAKSEKGREEGGGKRGGWLGGILGKLSLRPPNQMILPDDKNPTIVWDEAGKRWRNTAGDDAAAAPPPPPPTLPAHALRTSSPPLQAPPGGAPPPVANIFKMQKSRHIKKSYVDVLNPGGARAAPPPAPPAYFVPPPAATQGGMYDPSQAE
ncbi:uncharacterized protein LOC106132932 isoform X2 [Amyelois transitella]|uniref:uncharacterized protein LOC106132932 isoform X2 n=1 Tax=Amyelois transitella TaxID=680683 RepID=UPI00299028A0|nr:uncharacterized protein LOC106132932 isoform X2 [Amyelois transitella]